MERKTEYMGAFNFYSTPDRKRRDSHAQVGWIASRVLPVNEIKHIYIYIYIYIYIIQIYMTSWWEYPDEMSPEGG